MKTSMVIAISFSFNCLCAKVSTTVYSVCGVKPIVRCLQLFWFKYKPGGISLGMMFSRTSCPPPRSQHSHRFSCHDSTYETHCHRVTFPTIVADKNKFSEPTYETPKDAVKTPSCTTSYCFKTVLSQMSSERRHASDCTSFTFCLDVFSYLQLCHLLDSRNVQNKHAVCRSFKCCFLIHKIRSKYYHADRAFKYASATVS